MTSETSARYAAIELSIPEHAWRQCMTLCNLLQSYSHGLCPRYVNTTSIFKMEVGEGHILNKWGFKHNDHVTRQQNQVCTCYVGGFPVAVNPLTPNEHYSGRTAPLTSKRCILYIYSTNTGTEYFKHGVYSPFFPSSKCSLFHNSDVFGSCFTHILYTGYAKI